MTLLQSGRVDRDTNSETPDIESLMYGLIAR